MSVHKETNSVIKLLDEPELQFGQGQYSSHPKDGLMLFGPSISTKKRGTLNYGIVSTTTGKTLLTNWVNTVRKYIPPFKEDTPHHSGFPGFEAVFGMDFPDEPIADVKVDEKALANAIRISNRHEAVKTCVDVFEQGISSYLLDDADVTPDFWYVVVPDEIYKWARTKSAPPVSERIVGKAKMKLKNAKEFLETPSFFEQDNWEADLSLFDLNFHNQLKARLLNRAVVQIVRERTLREAADLTLEPKERKIQDPATVAWNLCTTSFYKSSGPPWKLADIRRGVCYVGIVFKNDTSDPNSGKACCGAQLFLRSGEGLVFKGAVGNWYSKELKQYHLTKGKAEELMTLALEEYERKHNKPPDEVFIHGRSRFNEEEWAGFNNATKGNSKIVAIRIRPTDELKLYRLAKQPPVRCSYLQIHSRMAYLWTKGYVPRFGTYPGFEVPNPLAINIDWGDADIEQVLSDILALTKVNFNGCTFADGLPVTLKFADAIGEILTAAPNLDEAPSPFKFYI